MPCEDPSEDYMLDVSDLVFGYTENDNLKGIDMKIKPGEFVGLLGPNGSGKTTLMRCINKILKIREGSILIDEQDILELNMEDIAKICTTVPADTPLDTLYSRFPMSRLKSAAAFRRLSAISGSS